MKVDDDGEAVYAFTLKMGMILTSDLTRCNREVRLIQLISHRCIAMDSSIL